MGPKYYAVQSGRNTGVYTSWADAKAATDGYPGAVHKSFSSASEAKAFASSSGGYRSSRCGSSSGGQSLGRYSGGSSNSSGGYSRGYSKSSQRDVVYTDGSSRSNGQAEASAGYGVYYGSGDSRNYSGKLKGDRQTNQRAELKAVDYALSNAQNSGRDIHIMTDSQYTKNSLTTWGDRWDANGYKNAKGQPVVNRDLIESARSKISDLQRRGINVTIDHVKGHAGHAGNEAADRLANAGAMK